eukprot:5452157-Prymnesium_polylepis.1
MARACPRSCAPSLSLSLSHSHTLAPTLSRPLASIAPLSHHNTPSLPYVAAAAGAQYLWTHLPHWSHAASLPGRGYSGVSLAS